MPYTQTSTALGTIDADEATSYVSNPARNRPEAVLVVSSTSVTVGAVVQLEGRIQDKASGTFANPVALYPLSLTANGPTVVPLHELRAEGINIEAYDELRLNAGTAWTDGTHVFTVKTTSRTTI